MAKRKVFEHFIDLPKGVQNFFMDEADELYKQLIDDYKIPEENFFDLIEEPVLNATLGYATVKESLTVVYKNIISLNIEKENQKKIITLLLQKVYWPLRDLFGLELTQYLQELNVSTVGWPPEQVLFQPLSYSGAASEVVNRLGLYSVGRQVRTSLREQIEKFAKGEIVPDQLKEKMIQLPEFGGMGLDPKTADKALNVIQQLAEEVEFISEEDFAEMLAAKTLRPEQGAGAIKETEEDEEEIKTIKQAMPEPKRDLTELDHAVLAAWNAIAEKPEDDYLSRRLRNVISSRLRDVRNASELKQLLQRDTKVGGLGLDREQSDKIAAQIEEVYGEYHGKIQQEEKNKLEKQLIQQKHKIEERRKQEAEEHARWYQEKIKARQEAESEKKQIAEALKKGFTAQPKHPVDQKAAIEEKKKYGSMVPAAKAASSRIATAPPKSGSAPTHPPVRVSAQTAKMAERAPLRVDGVSAAPKLQGLTGELGGLTLAQFRRMGKTPQESVQKILSRLDALQAESLEKRISGIRAWQISPVMKMYLSLVAESFKTMRPIAQIAETQRKEGTDTLTQDEIEALIQLNNQLHF